MPHAGLSAAVCCARRAALRAAPAARSDGAMLAAFLAGRDADAFAELVARFGPMVFAVCRRLTGHHQDAEDAFQATFVVLARRAAAVNPREAVGAWLHGVAVRTAREARVVAAKRLARETPVARLPDPGRSDPERDDVAAVLHEELAGLPDKFRTLLVLCDLEGRPQVEVAGRLGLPVGTLYSRLAMARKALAERLRRRGVVLSASALPAALSAEGRAAVPSGLPVRAVSSAASPASVPPAVAALTQGVFRTMFLHKLKRAAVVGFVLLLAGAVAGAPSGLSAQDPPKPPPRPAPLRDGKKPPGAKPVGPGALLLVRSESPYQVLTPDGKTLSEVSAPRGTRGGGPAALSPDGTRVALVVDEEGPPRLPARDGEEPKPWPFKVVVRTLSKPEGEKTYDLPAQWLNLCWTADGKRVVVAKHPELDRGKSVENVLLDPATGKTEKLDLPAGAWVLDAGRDGKTLLVVVEADKKKKLALATLGGPAVRELIELRDWPPGSVTGRLSPDGAKVLFTQADPDRKSAHKWGVSQRPYLLDVKTKKAEPLAEFPDNAVVRGIAWAPDGKRVAYTWQQLHEELLKKDSLKAGDTALETEAFLIVADLDGKNAKTVASEKGPSALNMIFGTIDWR